jgi:hypothetical protein
VADPADAPGARPLTESGAAGYACPADAGPVASGDPPEAAAYTVTGCARPAVFSVTGLGVLAGTVMVRGGEPSEGTTTKLTRLAPAGATKPTDTSPGEGPPCTNVTVGAAGAPAAGPPLVPDANEEEDWAGCPPLEAETL